MTFLGIFLFFLSKIYNFILFPQKNQNFPLFSKSALSSRDDTHLFPLFTLIKTQKIRE